MTTITVLAQILAGNMGELEAGAEALADFTREKWLADLADLAEAGHKINIDIDVQNASGCSRAVEVWCDDPELQRQAESALTDETRVWDLFCQSEEARAL